MPPPIDVPKTPGKLSTRGDYFMNILPGLLVFLAKYNADFLYYQVWPTEDEDIRLKIAKQEEQATSIDVIEQARTEEFCSPQQQALARRISGLPVTATTRYRRPRPRYSQRAQRPPGA